MSPCPDCQGYGYHWRLDQDDEWIDPAPACLTCDGEGRRLKCTDHWCAGSRWPLTSHPTPPMAFCTEIPHDNTGESQ